ncbi:hypothetical protein [Micromonospora sp. NPDC005413]|uniref:hypothetical protein n=1 Tax=Micromonospora sp. NPDC005413 TaxID=3154563 RepID=UPI0033B2F46F
MLLDAGVVQRANECEESLEALLVGLLAHDLIELYRYSDDGPPVDAPRFKAGDQQGSAIGWVEVLDDSRNDYRGVWWANDSSRTFGSFHLSLARLVESESSAGASVDPPTEQVAERARLAGNAAGAAEAVGAHLFVTNRAQLTASRYRQRKNWLSPSEAIAFVSLYLRAQDVYLASVSPDGRYSIAFDRGMFFWVGTRELLPSAWRYVGGLMQHSTHQGVEDLGVLPLSVLERVQRVLEARDVIHVSLNRPHSRRAGDEAISSFETALLFLMAALDATAVVAHIVLGFTGPQYHAGWQNPGWIARVQKTAGSKLADIFVQGSRGKSALTILQHLRNSIHGAPLQNVTYQKGGAVERSLFSFPQTRRQELMDAISALGGNSLWGVEKFSDDHILVDAGVMLDRLLPEIFDLLNKVMDLTPIESLEGVSLSPGDVDPPSDDGSGHPSPFHEGYRLSARWQLGFST